MMIGSRTVLHATSTTRSLPSCHFTLNLSRKLTSNDTYTPTSVHGAVIPFLPVVANYMSRPPDPTPVLRMPPAILYFPASPLPRC